MEHENSRKKSGGRYRVLVALIALLGSMAAFAEPKPVLMVIANQDFYWQEYATTRAQLEAHGLEVVVAAATTETAYPQGPQTWPTVKPDLALSDVNPDDNSAIVFIGGYGASQYQYDFPGSYDEPDYQPATRFARVVNNTIYGFSVDNKPVAAVCYGVSVLAWARVDGQSLIRGRVVTGFEGGVPGFRLNGTTYPDAEVPLRWFVEKNGGTMLTSRSVGDPMSSHDDVVVDGNIVTAENYDSAALLAEVMAQMIAAQQ